MKLKSTFLALSLLVITAANAQRGNNALQLGAEGAIPTGNLSKVTNFGYGAYLKGMYGFSQNTEQVTLEVGYNRFPVKNLPSGFKSNYAAIPVYAGFRYIFGSFIMEPQAGISINTLSVSDANDKITNTTTKFAYGLGIGYQLKRLALGARYQTSETERSDVNISYFGIRIGYNILQSGKK